MEPTVLVGDKINGSVVIDKFTSPYLHSNKKIVA